jgi:hypothetical protein
MPSIKNGKKGLSEGSGIWESRRASVRETISRLEVERFLEQEGQNFRERFCLGYDSGRFRCGRDVESLRIPTEKLQDKEIESVKERVTCLKWEMGRTPSLSQIKASLIKSFEETGAINLLPFEDGTN